jgi:hypothetical protein
MMTAGILGFFTSTFLAAMAIRTVLSSNRDRRVLLVNLVFAITLTLVFYLFFVKLMMVRFPDAPLV